MFQRIKYNFNHTIVKPQSKNLIKLDNYVVRTIMAQRFSSWRHLMPHDGDDWCTNNGEILIFNMI